MMILLCALCMHKNRILLLNPIQKDLYLKTYQLFLSLQTFPLLIKLIISLSNFLSDCQTVTLHLYGLISLDWDNTFARLSQAPVSALAGGLSYPYCQVQ